MCSADARASHRATGEPSLARLMSRQLHETTQPLSVLRGELELALIRGRSVEDCRKAIEMALIELHRVDGCFAQLRRILADIEDAGEGADCEVSHV